MLQYIWTEFRLFSNLFIFRYFLFVYKERFLRLAGWDSDNLFINFSFKAGVNTSSET